MTYGMTEHSEGSREIYNVLLDLEALGIWAELQLGFTHGWCTCSSQSNVSLSSVCHFPR